MSRQYVHGASSSVRMRRNKFDLSHGVKTSLSVGTLVPIDVQEVLPGDTFILNETHVARLTSSYLRPVMDNCWLDVYHFFVPLRLLYDEAENVFGVAEPDEYESSDLSQFPVTDVSLEVYPGSIADYMGLPVFLDDGPRGNKYPTGISILPFRAFAMIYNEWFRNENVQQSVYIHKGEFHVSERFNNAPWGPDNYTGKPPKITKKKDYFTSCLPAPQKGDPVVFSIGGRAPVVDENGTTPVGTVDNAPSGSQRFIPNVERSDGSDLVGSYPLVYAGTSTSIPGRMGMSQTGIDGSTDIVPTYMRLAANFNDGIFADLSQASAVSVNDMRFAFQLQKMLEKDARYGTRYREYLLGHFGVSNADARMQIPEFLGGHRTPLGTQAIAQTSAQTQQSGQFSTPLATLGAMSHSVGKSRYVKSFTEHGYVITVAAIRQLHTYQQGIERFWARKERNDFYDPLFANLGEQPVYEYQLYPFISEADPNVVLGTGHIFGYQEYGAEYRFRPSYITGQMRTGVQNSLDIYHFGDYYENAPKLGPTFINETSEYFDRTVAVPSSSQDNFILDFWFDCKAVRVMPLYSTPGLIDHH